MFEKAEAEQLQLSEKKRMVEADKAKIHAVRIPFRMQLHHDCL